MAKSKKFSNFAINRNESPHIKKSKKSRKKSPNLQNRKSSPLRMQTNIKQSAGIDVNFSYSRNLIHS